MHRVITAIFAFAAIALIGSDAGSAAAFQAPAASAASDGRLVVFGDVTLFLGKPGAPGNCALQSRFKRGEPVGFRAIAIDPVTGEREPSAQFVVHLTYGGQTQDVPMRYRATAAQPERQFWVAKWIVPATAPTGIVRYTVTAKDKNGRTGEWKPFVVEDSQVTIVE
ncbi:MAG: hypothetical protein ND807_13655 [Vicinamibacterales bacterium]|nr:hypothetical protein [Vicinamibacterales bacterium]